MEHQKLTATIFTDMVGHRALSRCNEALALELPQEHRRIVRGVLSKRAGRGVETTGGGFLIHAAEAKDRMDAHQP